MNNSNYTNTKKYDIFLKCLSDNKIYETTAAELICDLNNTTVKEWCDDYRYDFMTDDELKYEVKCDHKVLQTGIFFIEFTNRKLSGISTTESDYYVLCDTKYYFLIRSETLKALCENKRIVQTYDRITSGYLVSRYEILKFSKVLI